MSAPELFLSGRVALYCGDSREVLRTLPDASIHAVVTDPPYALEACVSALMADAAPRCRAARELREAAE
ncbi:site-specific DNA-methyltransferase [Xanthobacter tagetidis]|uniref:Site-specific DNA-methyltransferase n=1 Tax=Xanthobacter tagetidis TaxID=60216 RepID=A0A3L7AJ83_9HYPH|nr:site-specific DNA-methyltransferase [Xanthobacter tagetidis]MBB6308927.1 putative methyltransferase [Xanthobacter tagetidis]RLP80563.1 site-specific DNA-methyltransferase [Xanthobacter tagetidis]